jgi:gluconate 5-dehydrogenase
MAFELFNLAGKRALVTGSSQGIGLAIARGLAEHGAAIVLNGRDGDKLAGAAAILRACSTSPRQWRNT